LTPKHVDVPELVRVLDFEPVPDPVIEPVPCGPGQLRYPTPVREFALCRAEVTDRDAVAVTEPGPNIVLCTDGAAELRSGRETLTLERGAAAWVSAADSEVTARAVGNTPAQVFTASVAL
ncbi:MAG: mannose-6-phosphate isomerase, class I, partial [Mycobacteriaceae bacterium]|nr:mannose-6-phosphate isomerase, class I [Mycobacteriaceae bacterium]